MWPLTCNWISERVLRTYSGGFSGPYLVMGGCVSVCGRALIHIHTRAHTHAAWLVWFAFVNVIVFFEK